MPSMAPMSFNDVTSLKRNSTTANFDAPAAKKQNRGPLIHHKLNWLPTEAERHQSAPQDGESMDTLLERAIILALEAVGFAGADPRAIQAFRLEVEEYMLHLLGDVRQSMLISKRTQPTPGDFLQSLHTHQLLLRSLLPHLNPPVPPERAHIQLSPDTTSPIEHQISSNLFLSGAPNEQTRSYIPSHFPVFPSEHTYKATSELPSAERDPRKVRELVAEEARLGEAALRRLVGASSDLRTSDATQPGKGIKSMRAKRDDAWKEAMLAVTPGTDDWSKVSGMFAGFEGQREGSTSAGPAAGTSRMSADALGKDLLSEVKAERFDEFLHSLRAVAPLQDHVYGIPALDSLIAIFHTSGSGPPFAQQSHTSASKSSHAPGQPRPLLETRPPVLELAGATACSGKTQVLYHLTALMLLPQHHDNVPLKGKEAAVVLFDLSNTFSILRLHDIMLERISAAYLSANTSVDDALALIQSSLQHLHIYRPQSLSSLLSALDALESYLLSTPPAHLSAPRPLGLIALSNLSAFYWPARLEAEEAALNTDTSATNPQPLHQFLDQHRALVASLRDLQRTFDCPVVATNMTLSAPIYSPEGAKVRPHLPAVWNNFVTVKVVLQRDQVPRFGPEISVEEAEGERGMRWAAVEKAGFRGWVDWWGAEGWSEQERERVRRWKGMRFAVRHEGVVFM
ncbi:hypothetical protein G7Y79_00032g067410 [Physcia stellaris]|nr:hypothetical protein G7Y79_00032g067410 [Physcia stellaris]